MRNVGPIALERLNSTIQNTEVEWESFKNGNAEEYRIILEGLKPDVYAKYFADALNETVREIATHFNSDVYLKKFDMWEKAASEFSKSARTRSTGFGDKNGLFSGFGIKLRTQPYYQGAKDNYDEYLKTTNDKEQALKIVRDKIAKDFAEHVSQKSHVKVEFDGTKLVPKSFRSKALSGQSLKDGLKIDLTDVFLQTVSSGSLTLISNKPLNYWVTANLSDEPVAFGGDVSVSGTLTGGSIYGAPPVGSVVAFAGEWDVTLEAEGGLLQGWLLCDGRALNDAEYPELYAAIKTAHGAGYSEDGRKVDGATFNLPDLRGQFLRGAAREKGDKADPDTKKRTDARKGGNTGNNVGSFQDFATSTRGISLSEAGAHTPTGTVDVKLPDKQQEGAPKNEQYIVGRRSNDGDKTAQWNKKPVEEMIGSPMVKEEANSRFVNLSSLKFETSLRVDRVDNHRHDLNGGGNETRPKNIAVHYLIRVRNLRTENVSAR